MTTSRLAFLQTEALDVHVCMGATGVYWEEVAQFLAPQGLTVSGVNPAQIKAYAASRLTRSKTDALDARLIAEFCTERQPPPCSPDPKPKSPYGRSCCGWTRCKPCAPRKAIASASPTMACGALFKNTWIGSINRSSP